MLDPNSLKKISPEARLTWLIARWLVYNQNLSEIEKDIAQRNVDWEKFRRIASYHELLPFAHPAFKRVSYLLPDREEGLLKQCYYSCLVHQAYLRQEFKKIVAAFCDKNIEFLPLKGVAFIIDNIYADKTYLRPMCDMDLLIKKETLPVVENILGGLGYEKDLRNMKEDYWKNKNYHLGFIKRIEKGLSYIIEIHWALDYKRNKPILSNLWKRIKKCRLEDKEINLLSAEDTLFCLGLHQRRFGKMLCLKNVCDVAMVLNKYSNKLDWDYILKEAKAGNMRATLYFIFTQANLLINIQIHSFVLKNLDLPRYKQRLIERFILKNTFSSDIGLNNGKSTINSLYLKSHFLIHDNFWEPMRCVLSIPQEQFAKFYRLSPYNSKTSLLYKIRYLYILTSLFTITLKTIARLLKSSKKNLNNSLV